MTANVPDNHPVMVAMADLARKSQAPWQISLETYLRPSGTSGPIEIKAQYEETANQLESRLDSLVGEAGIERSWPSMVSDKHTVALLKGDEYFVLLNETGRTVGAYMMGDMFIRPGDRKLGLGAELLLTDAVLFCKGRMGGLLYSPVGYKAAVSSHKLAQGLKPADAPKAVRKAVPGLSR